MLRTRFVPAVAAIGLATATLTGTVLADATPAAAATSRPYFMPWQPGTPLPKLGDSTVVYAWPSATVLGRLSTGQKVPIKEVGYTTATGTFVQLVSRSELSTETNASGFVNLEVAPDGGTPPGCTSPRLGENYGKKWTTVGQSYSSIVRTTQKASYGADQSSSLEVGESASGSDGSFTGSGTVSVDTSGTQYYPEEHKGNEYWQTYFRYGLYNQECNGIPNYTAQAYEWAAGDKIVHPKHRPKIHGYNCVPELAGGGLTKSTTKASTIKIGFTIPVIGFSGTAQTGYSATLKIGIHFGRSGYLCGLDDVPGGPHPGALSAQLNP
jgi:hypothetical protein